MSSSKKFFIFIIAFIFISCLAMQIFPQESAFDDTAEIRIGAGDDISGILANESASILDTSQISGKSVELSAFQDCWTNLAQWALSADEINVALYCNHVAMHTIEENSNVMIYGPVIMNAEILCYKKNWDEVKTVGVVQGREQEKSLLEETYPQIETFSSITQKGILYSLEDEQVDAIVQDISKAAAVPEYSYKSLSEHDYISYVLVVEKTFAKTNAFSEWIRAYNLAVQRLNQKQYLAKKLDVSEDWLADKKIEFLSLDESGD